MRWLLLDEIISIEKGRRARTRSHVPQAPEYSPELLMIEMMAQTAAVLMGAEKDFQEDLVFVKIDRSKFRKDFAAAGQIDIEARAETLRPEGAWFETTIDRAGERIAEARLMLLNVGHFAAGKTEPMTFHGNFMNHFKVREKVQ